MKSFDKEQNMIQFETQLVHSSAEKIAPYHGISMPIYNSVAYEFETAEEMEKVFCGKQPGFFYSRVSNPTVSYFENRIQEITGALSVSAFNSGMAAIQSVLMAVGRTGSNIITASNLFGNTYALLKNIFSNFGVETRFCNMNDLSDVRNNIDKNTCALFVEIISNPQMEVVNLKELSSLAKEVKVPFIVDTTVVPFCAFKGKSWGIDIEVISSTKYISGGGTSNGGLVLDYATFDWSQSQVMGVWNDLYKEQAFSKRMEKEISRNLGVYMSPQVAYMQTLGLETLQVRYEKQAANCLALASQLQHFSGVYNVNYPGLEGSPYYKISSSQFGKYPCAMLTFELISREACFSFLNRLKIIRRSTNLFDNKSLIIHPASTIYGTFTREQRTYLNISEKMIRLSLGLEALDDLLGDISQALI